MKPPEAHDSLMAAAGVQGDEHVDGSAIVVLANRHAVAQLLQQARPTHGADPVAPGVPGRRPGPGSSRASRPGAAGSSQPTPPQAPAARPRPPGAGGSPPIARRARNCRRGSPTTPTSASVPDPSPTVV